MGSPKKNMTRTATFWSLMCPVRPYQKFITTYCIFTLFFTGYTREYWMIYRGPVPDFYYIMCTMKQKTWLFSWKVDFSALAAVWDVLEQGYLFTYASNGGWRTFTVHEQFLSPGWKGTFFGHCSSTIGESLLFRKSTFHHLLVIFKVFPPEAFLAFVWFGSSPAPSPTSPISKLSLLLCLPVCVAGRA